MMQLFILLLMSLSCLMLTTKAWTDEIAYDNGGEQVSTVIGYYTPENASYILSITFSVMAPELLTQTIVLVHAHVGVDLKPVQGETKARIAVRVNGGSWHWQTLTPFQDDGNHWLEIEVPVSEWHVGLNRVEVNSNVMNPSNHTRETLDMLGCTQPPIYGRSMYSVDEGKSFHLQNDRNWGIRLRFKERNDRGMLPVSLKLSVLADTVALNEYVQCIVESYDGDGNKIPAANALWSTTGGIIDSWGLYRPEHTGRTAVNVRIGDLQTTRSLKVVLKMPLAIEPPNSPQRLATRIPEGHCSLSGCWQFRLDRHNRGEEDAWYLPANQIGWGEIAVPGAWQSQGYGLDYHGIGWYRRSLSLPEEWAGKQLWLQFQGVATKATVWLNGARIGEHVGNWTPFTLPMTDAFNTRGDNILVVRVEELPGHFSAGFPREIGRFGGIDSHFGGLWQDVTMFATGNLRLVDVFVQPRLQEQKAAIHLELCSITTVHARIVCSILDEKNRRVAKKEIHHNLPMNEMRKLEMAIDIPEPQVWSPQSPYLYTVVTELYDGNLLSDRRITRFGMRSVECKGTQILLNRKPLMVRGVLHWGYYPDLLTITPSEERIKREFQDLRDAGFNLVKVCLFLFPRRFYEIADETGMLLWQEYPTWLYVHFPQAGDHSLDADFAREYPEWFRFDRNYPSIILRDLTCEAHINPNFDLLERTYRTGKELTGGALICDNSSFFKHRITDWYVCHTYRDLDEYYEYFASLVGEMRGNLEKKPFLFGEDFDADTYRDSKAIYEAFVSDVIPWWLDNANFKGQLRFDKELRLVYGEDALERLVDMQKKHALAIRKSYFEEFRRYPEPAGFVMTSLRDITATRPGFYDDLLQPKWNADAWRPFNADRVLVLFSERRSRCFRADDSLICDLILSNYGKDIAQESLLWRLMHENSVIAQGNNTVSAQQGQIQTIAALRIALEDFFSTITAPMTCRLEAELGQQGEVTRNSWNVWIFPTDDSADTAAGITIYAYSPEGIERLIAAYPGFSFVAVEPSGTDVWIDTQSRKSFIPGEKKNAVMLTDTIDDYVSQTLNSGMRVVYIPDADKPDLYNRQWAPFWREMAIWLPEGTALADFPHEGFIDLQFLDLTQRKPFVLGNSRYTVKPLIWGINARNPSGTIYDYVFETRYDNGGCLLACCLNLAGEHNVAGRYLLRCLIQRISL